MEFITIGSNAIHVARRQAAADRPLLVFINSLGTDLRIWDAVAADLQADFSLLLYDKRGHGLSDLGATPPVTIEDHAADLAGLIDAAGADRVVLCGLSIGGLIAQQFAAAHPDRVRAVVLCDTAHKIGTPDFWNQRIAAFQRDGLASIAEGILDRWFTPGFRTGQPALFAGCRNMLVRQPVDGYAAACAAVRDADLTAMTATITAPTLVVVGDQDGSTPPDLVRSTAALIPGATFEIIPDAGHIPCVEQPADLVARMRRFFSDQGLLS